MNQDRRQLVETLFAEIVERPSEQWPTLIAERCAGDGALRAELQSLLGHVPEAAGAKAFLDPDELRKHRGVLGLEAESIVPNTRIAEFTILGKIGEGGMGVVYIAEQARPRRTVALKLIRRGLATPSMTRRFEHEAEVLGRLAHPGIAQIYEAGVAPTPAGVQPYIAMERIDGPTITDFCSTRAVPLADKLRLMVQVCDAVQHAHQRGVIHRDLKPSNILVAAGEAAPQPKILDFGVARVIQSDGEHEHLITSLHTGVGQFIGTLAYMSPEQVLADASQIDTRSDVYSLGVILFELITGRLPIDIRGKSMPEAARLIREADPTRLTTIDRALRGDLETIVGKALEKDRERRYASAAELGDELRRFLDGRPILAKQDSAMYVLRKQFMRNRVAGAAVAAALVALLTFTAYAWWQSRVQARLADGERIARQDADRASAAAKDRSEALRRNLYVSAIGFAQAAYASSDADRMRRVLASCPEDMRGWEWRYLHSIADSSRRVQQLPANGFANVRPNARGTRIVAWSGKEPVQVFDTVDWREVARLDTGLYTASAAIADDERTCIFNATDGSLNIADLSTGLSRKLDAGSGPNTPLAISADGAIALVASDAGSSDKARPMRLIDTRSGKLLRDLGPIASFASAFSPDGLLVAFGLENGGVRVCAAVEGGPADRTTVPHTGPVRTIAFSHDGRRVASGAFDGLVCVRELASGMTQSVPVSENKVLALAWSPDDSLIAASGTEPVIRIVDPRLPKIVTTLFGHEARVDLLAWSPSTLISAGRDGNARWWNAAALTPPTRNVGENIGAGCFDPRGRYFYVGLDGGDVAALDPVDLRTVFMLHTPGGHIFGLASSHDGDRLAVGTISGEMFIFDVESRAIVAHAKAPTGRPSSISFGASDKTIAMAFEQRHAEVFDVATGARVLSLPEHTADAVSVRYSPDGSTLAVGYRDGKLFLHDAASGRVLREVVGHEGIVFQVRFAANGKVACSGDDFGLIQSWDARTGVVLDKFRGHQHGAFTVSINHDATRLVSGGWDNTVRVWQFDDGQELLTLRAHIAGMYAAEFSPDGETLISASSDGWVRVWSAGRK